MTSPFADIADPAVLRAMVQNGVECERCHGIGQTQELWIGGTRSMNCPTCNGTGHTPLSNADLNALAACWCWGEWVRAWGNNAVPHFWQRARAFNDWEEGFVWDLIPAYTTSPDAAMRLQVQYNIGLTAFQGYGMADSLSEGAVMSKLQTKFTQNTVEARCHAITTAALLVALTRAMEGGGQ